MFAAPVSIFPRPLPHPDKLEVAPISRQLRHLLTALQLQGLVAPDPAVIGAQQLGGLHGGPITGPGEARGYEPLLPGPSPVDCQAIELLEQLGPVR